MDHEPSDLARRPSPEARGTPNPLVGAAFHAAGVLRWCLGHKPPGWTEKSIEEIEGTIDLLHAEALAASRSARREGDRLRVCLVEPSAPFVCEAYGKWNAESLAEINEDLKRTGADVLLDVLGPLDSEECAWITARYITAETDQGYTVNPADWEIDVYAKPEPAP